MRKELKIAIINWLFENKNVFNITNECRNAFRAYIYDETGHYLIGGEDVSDFIDEAESLLFRKYVD